MHPDDVQDAIDEGAMVFATDEAVLVVEITDYPKKKNRVCDAVVAGGKLSTVINILLPEAEKWARENHCTHCVADGRPGWSRPLSARGYKTSKWVGTKELDYAE